jgi:hypothetical protein
MWTCSSSSLNFDYCKLVGKYVIRAKVETPENGVVASPLTRWDMCLAFQVFVF